MSKEAYLDHPVWAKVVSRLVKAQMAANGLSYADLSRRLQALGTEQTATNLKTKINRGSFGAQLFIQLFLVMDATSIDLARAREMAQAIEREDRDS